MTQAEAIKKLESWLLIPLGYEEVLPALRVIRNTPDFESYAARVADAEFKSTAEVVRDVDAFEGSLRQDGMSDDLVNKLEAISGKKYPDRPGKSDDFDVILESVSAARGEQTAEELESAKLQEKYGAFVQGYVRGGSRAASAGRRDSRDDGGAYGNAGNAGGAYGNAGGSYGNAGGASYGNVGYGNAGNAGGSLGQSAGMVPVNHAHPYDSQMPGGLARPCPYCRGEVISCLEEKMSSNAVVLTVVFALCFWPLIFIPLCCMKKEQRTYWKCRDCGRRIIL